MGDFDWVKDIKMGGMVKNHIELTLENRLK